MKFVAAVFACAACGDNVPAPPPPCDDWPQWAQGAGHDGSSCVTGQGLGRVLADLQLNPFITQEQDDTSGDLVIHYQSPLVAGDHAYVMQKHGTYTPCERTPVGSGSEPDCFEPDELYRLNTQIWSELGLAWSGDALAQQWSFDSDWKPEPGQFFEPMFQPALIGDRIAIPGASGSIWELDAATGATLAHIAPFGDDPDAYVAGALAVDHGRIYYNAVRLDHANPLGMASRGALVAIDDGGGVHTADYVDLVPGAPDGTALCDGDYDFTKVTGTLPPLDANGMPLPPQQVTCGRQMPGLNSAPAFAEDGTLYVVSHAQFDELYSYVISVNPANLTPNWATSLRGLVHDGCGELVTGCTPGAPGGVNPATGEAPALAVDDASSSSPVALPGGGVLYGAFSGYNAARGHLVALSDRGGVTGTYDFGWDTTPAVLVTAAGVRIVLKDNHYGEDANGADLGPYFITELDAQLAPVWKFQSTETESCTRAPDGTLTCVANHPHGFEWCINAPAIDAAGTIYANSEDGHLYALTADGQLRDRMFLERAIGAAYTPLALDHAGRIFSLNNGHLVVVGN